MAGKNGIVWPTSVGEVNPPVASNWPESASLPKHQLPDDFWGPASDGWFQGDVSNLDKKTTTSSPIIGMVIQVD